MADRLAENGALEYAVDNYATASSVTDREAAAGYIAGAYNDFVTWRQSNPTEVPSRLTARGRLYGKFSDSVISSASLDLNFQSGSLDSKVTLTRSSSATYVNFNGVIQSAGNDVARFDYDPITRVCKGLLLEESRQNLVTYSAITNANWTDNVNGVITDAGVTAPDNTTSIVLTAASTLGSTQTRALSASFSLTTTTQYTYSCYIKKGNMRYAFINSTGAAFTGTDPTAFFDLDTGLVSNSSAGVSTTSMTSVGNGWYRCVMTTVATNANGSESFYIGHTSTNGSQTHSANAGDYTYFWGAQVEAGTFQTSYIPTTTTLLTRSTDICSITGSNFSSWYNQTEGTFVCSFYQSASGTSSTFGLISANDGTANNRMYIAASDSVASDPVNTSVIVAGVTQASYNTTPTGYSTTSKNKSAFAYKLNDFATYLNNTSSSTDTSGTVPTVDRLSFATTLTNPQGQTTISRLTYYNKRLSNSILQGISA